MTKIGVFIVLSCSLIYGCGSKNYKNITKKELPTVNWNDTLKPGWVLTFQDEFNAQSLNREKWSIIPYHGSRYNPSLGIQICGNDNFLFTDTTLLIVSKLNSEIIKDTVKIDYSIGWLENCFVMDQKYGYFEIRCKLPKSRGMWPAFWLVSRHSWPPEIDIFEIYSSVNIATIESNLHFFKDGRHTNNMKRTKIPDPSEAFHTYAVEWQPELLVYYFDGLAYRRQKIKKEWFDFPMHLVVNSAVDYRNKKFLTELELPNYFEVDYVRAYKKIHPNFDDTVH